MKISKLILSLFLFVYTASSWADSSTYIKINMNAYPAGMFSVFCYVTGILYKYEKGNYAGIEVNFGKLGLYYDPEYGPNWWNYYCEPIKIQNHPPIIVKKFSLEEYMEYAYFTEKHLSRKKVHQLAEKYIKIKPHILEKVDLFVANNFSQGHIICIHYRGTDKIAEVAKVSYDEVLSKINKYIKKSKLTDYKIFIASDEQPFVDFMQASFPDRIIVYDADRSLNGQPIHFSASNNYRHGEEALIDSLLLSRGDILIRTSSNLSLWSTYFNPEIPVIELSKRG